MIQHIFRILGILLFFILLINYAAAISGDGANLDVRIDPGSYSLSTNESTSATSDFRGEGGESLSSLGVSTNNFLRFGILNFSLDVPVFNSLAEKDQDNNSINIIYPIITGETLTLEANISSSNSITSVYVSFWRNNKGSSKIAEGFLSLNSGLYSINFAMNYTYPFGPLNYTITANNSLGASIDLDDAIEIEYNTTLAVNNLNNVSYGQNLTLSAAYNYTNSTAVLNALCNYTVSGLNRTLPFSNQLYRGSINSTELGLASYTVYWNCGMNFHTNRSTTSNFTVNDLNTPTISGVTISPSDVIRTSDVIINATITDSFLHSTWIESDYTGSYINYTNLTRVTKNGNVYTFTIGAFNLSSNQNVSYRWYANDTTNNIVRGELHSFNVTNRLPGVPTLNSPQDGYYAIYDNTILFSWNTSDLDRETLFYNFQMANTSSFANQDLTVNTTLTFAGGNVNSTGNYSVIPTNLSIGTYYWRVRAKDNSSSYSSFSSTRSFNLIYALLNISAPFYDEVITTNTTNITIDEILNGEWVNSVDLVITVDGSSFTAAAANASNNNNSTTSYSYVYTIPSGLNSTYISITAVGRNGVNNANATSRFRTTKSAGTIRETSISYLCADRAYNAPNSSSNLTLNVNTGVLIDSVNVSLTYPNGTLVTLLDYQNNSDLYRNVSYANYSYEYNYSVAFGPVGVYTLNVEVRDVNYPGSSAVTMQRNLTVAPSVNLNLSMSGFNSFRVLDACSNNVLASGLTITSIMPEGRYNLVASTSGNKQVVELINANVSSLGFQVCNFTELDEIIAVPSNFRALDQFRISCDNNMLFDSVNLTYDYSPIISSILTENAIKVYKCDNLANTTCTWNLVSTNLKISGNNVTAAFTNFSNFMIGEDLSLVQLPSLPVNAISGGGSNLLNPGEDVILLDLLQPGKVTFYNNESIDTLITIKNNGNYTLEDITLSATSDSPKITLSFDQNHIDFLLPNEEKNLKLTISSLLADSGDHEIRVNAAVNKPNAINDNTLIFLDLIAHEENLVDVAEQQLAFLSKLFNENPECEDFEELANAARESFSSQDYRKSLQYTDAALQSCKNKVASEEKPVFSINKLSILETSDILLTSVEIVVLAFAAVMFYTYYKRRRIRKGRR